MKIAVGSTNPLKIGAVKSVAAKLFPGASVEGIAVDSGVGRNPLTDAETLAGAVARAKASRAGAGAEIGVGLEGGLTELNRRCYTCVWCAVDTGDGILTGGGVHIPVPRGIARMIRREGMEMGDAMDRLTLKADTKRTVGFEGIVTRGLIGRLESFEAVLAYTLAPLISPELYGRPSGRRRPSRRRGACPVSAHPPPSAPGKSGRKRRTAS
jgi:inosine/xanthosine triphosphatase